MSLISFKFTSLSETKYAHKNSWPLKAFFITIHLLILFKERIQFSISSNSILCPLTFTWKSFLPKWINSPISLKQAKSPVSYIISLLRYGFMINFLLVKSWLLR